MRNPFGPTFLQNDVEVIPAFRTARDRDISLERTQAILGASDSPHWRAKEMAAQYDTKTKELHFHWFSNPITEKDFNRALGYWREQRLAEIATIVLWVSSETACDQAGELQVHGFQRRESRETNVAYPALCFVSSKVRQW